MTSSPRDHSVFGVLKSTPPGRVLRGATQGLSSHTGIQRRHKLEFAALVPESTRRQNPVDPISEFTFSAIFATPRSVMKLGLGTDSCRAEPAALHRKTEARLLLYYGGDYSIILCHHSDNSELIIPLSSPRHGSVQPLHSTRPNGLLGY